MKAGPTLSRLGEIGTIYGKSRDDDLQKWTQATAIDDRGKIIRKMRVLNDRNSLKGFLKGLAKPLKGVIEAGGGAIERLCVDTV